ncbi:hypothetical protein JGU71_28210 [Antrihabitans sp. YC3-6]|uniref:Uncharacterized protein n=1 Tax=Antrihabitans stalagmiti TaxID=2799499 RepID=A0A934U6P3_9NOCA|nr:Gp19/Gp15/Gp42 family protein [Antrihabitans stalagmiti]MBJ8342780.1 hypothetical protein [Antrihabitans stalagmiti]
MADPFATPQDVESRWRPLSVSESAIATTLLADASQMIRERWPDIDARIASGAVAELTVVRIVCGMVKRAMLAPEADGVSQQSLSALQFGMTRTFANPTGNLYFNAADIAALDGPTVGACMGWLI